VDDNFIGNKVKLKQKLLPAIIAWMRLHKHPFSLSTEASIDLSDDEELMSMMVRAGFEGVFVGIETPNEDSLAECSKLQNRGRDLVACVRKIQSFGLEVRGGFIVGFDHDSPSVFGKQIELIQNSRIVTAMVGLLNAPRGSQLYQRIAQEGRLLAETTGDNTDLSTNIAPKMGLDALYQGYEQIISGIYSPRPYYERVRAYLRAYRPLEKKGLHFHARYLRLHFGYAFALPKTMLVLGVKDRARFQYWKLLFWSLVPAAPALSHGHDLCCLWFPLPQSLPGEPIARNRLAGNGRVRKTIRLASDALRTPCRFDFRATKLSQRLKRREA
jgi:radical SAM superfamily enzyme YgiQ (UPF0313 family)